MPVSSVKSAIGLSARMLTDHNNDRVDVLALREQGGRSRNIRNFTLCQQQGASQAELGPCIDTPSLPGRVYLGITVIACCICTQTGYDIFPYARYLGNYLTYLRILLLYVFIVFLVACYHI
jgi:hypothetical protein